MVWGMCSVISVEVLKENTRISVGNIFDCFTEVAGIVERILRSGETEWQFDVIFSAGTRVMTVVLAPITGLVETVENRTVRFYRAPVDSFRFLRVSNVRGELCAEIVTRDEIEDDVEAIPEEFFAS